MNLKLPLPALLIFQFFLSISLLSCKKSLPKSTLGGTNDHFLPRISSKDNSKKTVIVSTFPLFDAVRAVSRGVNRIDLNFLIKPGSEVHSFDPTPKDIININEADLFIYLGGESDEWAKRLVNNRKKTSLSLINFLALLDEAGGTPHEKDSHVWLNPENEVKIIELVSDSLCGLFAGVDSEETRKIISTFEKNKSEYIELVRQVASETRELLEEKEEKFIVIADRFPFLYYTNYYKIGYKAAFNGCGNATGESVESLSELIETVRKKHLPAVFYIEMSNQKIAKVVSRECGVPTLLLHSFENVTVDEFNASENYPSIMRRNLENLKLGMR